MYMLIITKKRRWSTNHASNNK